MRRAEWVSNNLLQFWNSIKKRIGQASFGGLVPTWFYLSKRNDATFVWCVTFQIRCHKYWPEDNKPMSVFSDILVSKVSDEVLPDWTVRTLKVEKVTKLISCVTSHMWHMLGMWTLWNTSITVSVFFLLCYISKEKGKTSEILSVWGVLYTSEGRMAQRLAVQRLQWCTLRIGPRW